MSTIIAVLIAYFGWKEAYKAAEEENWIRFFIGVILLVVAVTMNI